MNDTASTYRTRGHEDHDGDLAAAWHDWLTHSNPPSSRQQTLLNNNSSKLVFLKHEDSFIPSEDPLGDSQNPLKSILKHRHILKTRRQLCNVLNLHEQPSTQTQRVNTPLYQHDHYHNSVKMCFKYVCKDCKLEKYDYCKEYVESGRTWCTVTIENPWGGMKKKCETCVLMREVTHRLKVLVLREPYLLTEGMGGAPPKAAWEMDEAKEGVVGVVEVESDSD